MNEEKVIFFWPYEYARGGVRDWDRVTLKGGVREKGTVMGKEV